MVFKKKSLRLSSIVKPIPAALAILIAGPCMSQCVQPAIRQFGPYTPAPGSTITLANPLLPSNSPANSTLEIVTLGDSVVWGDGNTELNKYAVKVAQDLANGTGLSTTIVAYAHSGAELFTA